MLAATVLAAAAAVAASSETIIVTARLRAEDAQTIPVAVTALSGRTLERSGTVGMAGVAQLAPGLSYVSANPRNTAISIRGLGSAVVALAQANDGLEGGVGLYIDGVYRGRGAAGAFDFADIAQIEVLRGPQGTLFGKNAVAGAVTLTSRRPTFTPEVLFDAPVGDFGFLQARAVASGPIAGEALAARVSVARTQRDGILTNAATGGRNNSLGNTVARASLLFDPQGPWRAELIADVSDIRANCCTQVYARVGQTLRPAARQFPAMAAALGYVPPSTDPFDRISDIDAPLDLDTDDGGVTGIVARDGDRIALTSITAWRWWNWAVNNDADFTQLSIRPVQRIPSRQDQWSQELRVAATGDRLDMIAGVYAFRQEVTGEQTSTWGPQATFWLLGPAPGFAPNLLDGYAFSARSRFAAQTTALFGEGTWRAADGLALTLGLRQSWERKDGDYASSAAGGAVPRNAAEAAAKLSIARGQSYRARLSDSALTGRANVAWTIRPGLMVYAQHAVGEKSGGINMSGLPLDAANNPALATAVIKPEQVRSSEVGLKSAWLDGRLTVNLAAYAVRVRDFQTNIVDTGPGALRGYLANIGRVTSDGAELDAAWAQGATSARLSLAWTDARYGRFPNGGCPLEAIAGGTQVCDLTGRRLSGIPEWAVSGGFDHAWALAALGGDGFIRLDASWRSAVNGEATGSRFTKIDGYGLANMSVGLRRRDGLELSLFVRNLTDARYLTNVTVQQGNSGLVLGAPGEPRLIGVRLSVTRDGAPG